MIIAVDFDGTCVEHEFPGVGPDVPGAVEWLRRFAGAGARLILWTMRSDGPPRSVTEHPLRDAEEWFESRRIPLFGRNGNPGQYTWTSSPKAYAHLYVDDAAYGCPLVANPRPGGRPYVDWSVVGPDVLAMIKRHR